MILSVFISRTISVYLLQRDNNLITFSGPRYRSATVARGPTDRTYLGNIRARFVTRSLEDPAADTRGRRINAIRSVRRAIVTANAVYAVSPRRTGIDPRVVHTHTHTQLTRTCNLPINSRVHQCPLGSYTENVNGGLNVVLLA